MSDAAQYLHKQYGLEGKVAVVTGATGVLGGAIAEGLCRAGANVAVLGRRAEVAAEVAGRLVAGGGAAMPLPADVLDRVQLEARRAEVVERWGRVDILVNAAGGNVPAATLPLGARLWDLPEAAFREVFDLNLLGTVLPCQVFGEAMAERDEPSGSIVNISSASAARALTRVIGYSAAKGAVENLTRWLAVELARRHGEGMRVNAIAPGFFLADQNRAMLIQPDGVPTERGGAIIQHTPAARFGEPEELVGAVVWLSGPSASFVNGAVIPIDGGFGAFSGI